MSGLVELARQYVSLSEQLEGVREQIKHAVLNGGGGAVVTARPIQPAKKAGGSKSSHPHVAAAAQAEAKILELIRDQPLRTAQIAKLTEAKVNTTIERLKRLRDKGMATSDGGEWRASA